jgi:hypothetical protein
VTSRRRIEIDSLTFDPALWPRVTRDEARIEQLADVLRAGVELPPIKVQKGTTTVLGGWHTAAACRLVGEPSYFVEVVDVPPDERLLYAYREDVTAALPYSDKDTASVAQRLFRQRCTNGDMPNVVQLARDLGRARQTVDRWVADLVEQREKAIALKRAARVVAVQAFQASGLSTRRIEKLIGLSHGQVVSDAQVSIADHLKNSEVVAEAQSVIQLAISGGATVDEVEAARDWIIAQTDPGHLERRERRRVWMSAASEIRDVSSRLQAMTVPGRPEDWTECESARADIRNAIQPIEIRIAELKARVE